MNSEKELQLAYILLIFLLVVGIFSYTAAPARSPDVPVRLSMKAANGNVLFDHKTHMDEVGYGLSCMDCHHDMESDDPETATSCLECHETDLEDEDMPNRKDAFHQQCANCHIDFGSGPQYRPEDCSGCHGK